MRNNKKKGFTLVELLVVIAILAILATVSTVGYTAFVQKAKDSNANTELKQIEKLIEGELMDDNKLEFTVVETVVDTPDDPATEDDETTTKDESATYVIEKLNGALVCTRNGETVTANVALNAHPEIAALGGTVTVTDLELDYTSADLGDADPVTID